MKLLATTVGEPRRFNHRNRARHLSPHTLCQNLEHRLFLSSAPSSLIGDSLVLFATSGTAGSIPPSATQITFSSNSSFNEVNLITGATSSSTYTYVPLGSTASLVVTESTSFVSLTITFNSDISGTYSLSVADILHPESQSGIFVLSTGVSQLAAPSTIVNSELDFNVAGGAGTPILTSGSLNTQFFFDNTFTSVETPVLGSPSISNGTYTFFPSAASIHGIALLQTVETGNPNKHAILAFVSSTSGTFYLTDATFSNGNNGSLTDFSYGSFALLPVTITHTLTTLATSTNPALKGATVTLTASVLPNVAGSHIPTGTVTFKEGFTTLAVAAVNSSGQALLATASLSVGKHPITADFSGDANFAASSASTFIQVITYTHATNVAYVTQVYNDLLQRAPDGTGLDYWTNLLDTGAATLADVATALTSSREYDGIVVDAFYVQYLGRHSELAGLNIWIDQMQNGLNAEIIRAGILGSDEFFILQGGTAIAYVTVLYEDFLHRDPDADGLNVWTGQFDYSSATNTTQSRIRISAAISNSLESRTAIVTNFYQTFLHRNPDDPGLQIWITNLANGITQPQIISFFVTAQEYLNLHNIT